MLPKAHYNHYYSRWHRACMRGCGTDGVFAICFLVADDSSSGSGTVTPVEEWVHCFVAHTILLPLKANFNFCSLISPMLASRGSENKVISTTARNNKAADLYPTRTLAPWRNLHGGANHSLLLWECAVHLNAVSRGCQHWHQDWCLPCWHPTVHSNWCFQILTLGKQYVVSCRMLFLLSGLFIHTLKTSLFKLFAWALMNVYKALTKRFAGELPILTNPSVLNWYVTIQLFPPSSSLKGLLF